MVVGLIFIMGREMQRNLIRSGYILICSGGTLAIRGPETDGG